MKEKDIIGAVVIAVIMTLFVRLVGCGEVPDADLSNVVIDGLLNNRHPEDRFHAAMGT